MTKLISLAAAAALCVSAAIASPSGSKASNDSAWADYEARLMEVDPMDARHLLAVTGYVYPMELERRRNSAADQELTFIRLALGYRALADTAEKIAWPELAEALRAYADDIETQLDFTGPAFDNYQAVIGTLEDRDMALRLNNYDSDFLDGLPRALAGHTLHLAIRRLAKADVDVDVSALAEWNRTTTNLAALEPLDQRRLLLLAHIMYSFGINDLHEENRSDKGDAEVPPAAGYRVLANLAETLGHTADADSYLYESHAAAQYARGEIDERDRKRRVSGVRRQLLEFPDMDGPDMDALANANADLLQRIVRLAQDAATDEVSR